MTMSFTDPVKYEVMVDDHEVVPVERPVWLSWTGRRFLNGEEHHGGPVLPFGSSEQVAGLKPYIGSRMCPCKECQATVDPRFRMN